MFWRKKKLTYEILVPPESVMPRKPYEKYTPRQARIYYEWFISKIPERVEYLQKRSGVDLDYTVDSLVPLWRWFLGIAEIEDVTPAGIAALKDELKNMEEQHRRVIISQFRYQLSLQTEYICRDIGMYYGEVLVRNNEYLSWGYEAHRPYHVCSNIPLVTGFENLLKWKYFYPHFDPLSKIRGLARMLYPIPEYDKNRKPASENDLKNHYEQWMRFTPTRPEEITGYLTFLH